MGCSNSAHSDPSDRDVLQGNETDQRGKQYRRRSQHGAQQTVSRGVDQPQQGYSVPHNPGSYSYRGDSYHAGDQVAYNEQHYYREFAENGIDVVNSFHVNTRELAETGYDVANLFDMKTEMPPRSSSASSAHSDGQNVGNILNNCIESIHNLSRRLGNNMTNVEPYYLSRPNSANEYYVEPRQIRPLIRRHSLNDDFRRLQYNDEYYFSQYNSNSNSLSDFTRLHFRQYSKNSNSLSDCTRLQFREYSNNSSNSLSDFTRPQYREHSRSWSNCNNGGDVIENCNLYGNRQPPFHRFNPRCNSATNVNSNVRGVKRKSLEDDDFEGGQSVNGCSNSDLRGDNNFSFAGPCVKRRQDGFQNRSHLLVGDNYDREDETYEGDSENDFTTDNVKIQPFVSSKESFDVLDILSFPSDWSSCALEKTGFVDISFSSSEGKSLQQFFNRTSNTKDFQLKITGLTRIENPFLHSLYLMKKEEMVSRNGHVDELFLYHGTKKEHLSKICEDNLNWRLYSDEHRFGQGVSFSPRASYSSHYCDRTPAKVMILFKVLVSNVVVGFANMEIPPSDNNVKFDTSIKDDTSVIVKYSDNEFYPLYKIMYTKRMSAK